MFHVAVHLAVLLLVFAVVDANQQIKGYLRVYNDLTGLTMLVNGSDTYQTAFLDAFPLVIPPGGYSDFAFQMQVDTTTFCNRFGACTCTLDDADSGLDLFFNAMDTEGQLSISAIHVSSHQTFCGDGFQCVGNPAGDKHMCLDTNADVINLKEADGKWHTTTFSNTSRTLSYAEIRIAESS